MSCRDSVSEVDGEISRISSMIAHVAYLMTNAPALAADQLGDKLK